MRRTQVLAFPKPLGFSLGLLSFALALDLATTWLALTSGHAHEANPIAQPLVAHGLAGLLLVKLVCVAIALFLVLSATRSRERGPVRFLTVGLFLAAIVYLFIDFSNLSAALWSHDLFAIIFHV